MSSNIQINALMNSYRILLFDSLHSH